MRIQLNQTEIVDKKLPPALLGQNGRRLIDQQILDNLGEVVSCDPHGNPLPSAFASRDWGAELETYLNQIDRTYSSSISVSASRSIVAPNLLSDQTTAPKRKRLETTEVDILNPNADELSANVRRTTRGTIEMVVQPNGRKITPHYNKCGMLMRVELGDETELTRESHNGQWVILDRAGNRVLGSEIVSVTFDKVGNLIYSSVDGMTILHADGSIIRAAKGTTSAKLAG